MIIQSPTTPLQTSIITQTSKGNNIANTQSGEITKFDESWFPDIQRKYSNVLYRGVPTARYNCHGFTFTCRRTAIDESQEVWKVLSDDGYQEIPVASVLPGDIIIYFSDNGDVEHSGIVVESPDPTFQIPLVLSKWGKYREAVHRANNCPYDKSHIRYYRIAL